MTQQATQQRRFRLGRLLITYGAAEALGSYNASPLTYLLRHQAGDWGDLAADDQRENDLSVERGFRILSAYHLADGTKIWIITEADRSATTILLPEEY